MDVQVTSQPIQQIRTEGSVPAVKMPPKVATQDTTIRDVKEHMQMDPTYQPTLQEKTIIRAIEEANEKLMGANREFEFSIHEKTKQIMVKVLDKNTKEIIKEIPSEKILDYVAAMCESVGLFVDEKR